MLSGSTSRRTYLIVCLETCRMSESGITVHLGSSMTIIENGLIENSSIASRCAALTL